MRTIGKTYPKPEAISLDSMVHSAVANMQIDPIPEVQDETDSGSAQPEAAPDPQPAPAKKGKGKKSADPAPAAETPAEGE